MKYKKFIILLLLFCTFPKPTLPAKEKADYIVIGLGTAGATMAKLLSDDCRNSVIGIHNGKNLSQDPEIKLTENVIFTVLSATVGSSLYQTGYSPPQPDADNREILWAMGVPEGGDSSINAGAWARGTDYIYSQWESIAGPQWSTNIILDLYKSLESYNGTTTDPAARGYHGPINVRQNPVPTPYSIKFTQAIQEAVGVPFVLDYNDPNTPTGASTQLQYTQKGADGQYRVSSATAFLNRSVVTSKGKGVGGRKLRINLNSLALKTIWKGNKAIGVVYFNKGKFKKAYAKKGIIICGGLYSSAFLLHSGVGPKNVLTMFGIPVKYDNPNVGQNLADQTLLPLVFATNPSDTPTSPITFCNYNQNPSNISISLPDSPLLQSIANNKNRLFNTIFCNGFGFPGNSVFAQIAWLPAPGSTGNDASVRRMHVASVNPIPGLAFCLLSLTNPVSRGYVTLDSFNPFDPPIINNGLLSNSEDLDLYVQTLQTYIKDINNALQSNDEHYELIFPPAEILSDVNLVTAFVKETVMSNQCFQSHCLMAPLDQGGVVDSNGSVYGVKNLYVADASISPVPMDGTPMASAYMIAANIARMLLEQH